MKNNRELDKRDSIKVVTSNEFIKIAGLHKLSIKAIKLLYLIIAQCKKDDKEFYYVEVTPIELANLWGIKKQSVYKSLKEVSVELITLYADIERKEFEEFEHIPLFAKSSYITDEKTNKKKYIAKLNDEAKIFFLGLQKNFCQILLEDFNKMKLVNSVLIWHMMQAKLKTKDKKPAGYKIIKVTATIDELRRLSGTENKLKTLKDFKRYMLDKAIKEISETLNIDISYRSIKEGRKTIGFEFTLKNKHAISYDKLSNKAKDLIDKTKKIEFLPIYNNI